MPRTVRFSRLCWYNYDGAVSAFTGKALRERGLRLDEAGGKHSKDDAISALEDARLRVVVAFAHWFWCQRRLKDLVKSFRSFETSATWLASFSHLRRAARNAEVRWVAAIYAFKRLVESTAENSNRWEH